MEEERKNKNMLHAKNRTDFSTIPLDVKIPTVNELLDAGVHFGHAAKRWNPKMQQYIYAQRGETHIIDLYKTVIGLENALKFLKSAARRGDVMIVGTKRQAFDLVEETAYKCGAHFVSNRWAGGVLTNYSVLRKSLKTLKDLEKSFAEGVEHRTKQEVSWMKKDLERLTRLYGGIKHLSSKPVALVVIDAKREKIAVREARKAGIPVVALTDTNADPDLIDFVVAGNDDAVRSVDLFLNLVAAAIAEGNEGRGLVAIRKSYDAELARAKADAEVNKEKERITNLRKQEERQAMKKGESVVRIIASEPTVEKKAVVVKEEKKRAPKVEKVKKETAKKAVKPAKESSEKVSFESLGLSTRTAATLKKAKITPAALVKMSIDDVKEVKGVGPKALEEIKTALKI